MEQVLNYFETIPPLHRSVFFVVGITFFWILEGNLPLFNFNYKKWKHAIPNFFFTITTIIINFALAFLLLNTADWVALNQFGLLYIFDDLPLYISVFIGILMLDLIGAYLPHFLEHKIKPLWMIHLVHHTDHKVDTTTGNRHHPLESIIRFTFTLFGAFIIGANIGIVMLYQSLSVLSTQFTHANISLPKKIDYYLSFIIVSPDMHKIHHHYKLPYTDSNYGNVFSIWDRLFGTYKKFDRDKLIYGVDVFYNEEKNGKIYELLKQPFQKYRKPSEVDN